MRHTLAFLACLALAACAARDPSPASSTRAAADPLKASPECVAANLKTAEPLPVSALPADVLRRAQSGWVTVRYDVLAGKAQNAQVVASSPAGLYDDVVLRHARSYTEPSRTTVAGCIMTVNIKF